jgi:DNA topoisomerase-1
MSLDTVTLDDAVRLLTLPRALTAPDGEEIVVSNGRYGPFVKKGAETRSLESEEQLLTLTVDEAEAILAQPKQRRGRGAPKPPLKELGTDPGTGKTLVVKDGRFGPYVTDGETNASLRRGDDVERLTVERALELLAERRAKGPSQPRRTGRSRRQDGS